MENKAKKAAALETLLKTVWLIKLLHSLVARRNTSNTSADESEVWRSLCIAYQLVVLQVFNYITTFPLPKKQCDIIDPQILQLFLPFDIVSIQPRFHVAPRREKEKLLAW